MNPKRIYTVGLAIIIAIAATSCSSTQSTTYAKNEKQAAPKAQPIVLPNVHQEMQVEVVTPENGANREVKKTGEKNQ